jgi:hypothetical protein
MDRKKLLGALIIGKPMEKDEEAKEEPEEEAHSSDDMRQLHDEALDDVFDAVKAGDREAFRKAFSSAVRVCSMAEREGLYDDDEES